ncbi:YdcF family protein [Deinococcus altitudinis]|uniref:YdcF family protein n=1 Tax=Deinococcus altitudinis TaxID=468914 RepID=UPI00389250BE
MLTPLLPMMARAYTLDGPRHKVDAIIVLSGGLQCSSGALNSASFARVIKGLELWRAGYAPQMILSGGGEQTPHGCPKVATTAEQIVHTLYPTNGPRIAVLNDVLNTRGEAAQTRSLAKANGWKSFLLVTSPTHTRRAAQTFQDAGLNVTPIAADETAFDLAMPLMGHRLTALRGVVRELAARLTGRV